MLALLDRSDKFAPNVDALNEERDALLAEKQKLEHQLAQIKQENVRVVTHARRMRASAWPIVLIGVPARHCAGCPPPPPTPPRLGLQEELERERSETKARIAELEEQMTRQAQQAKLDALRRADYDSTRTEMYGAHRVL